ncbi:MAG: DUF192 domain-containing protein [Nevskiaceae bacterium]|jgi:uncharacterized membrane protein (UPF0127 family)|nr:DUF192 domain-containing protein [Nevskiaceae bacterium]
MNARAIAAAIFTLLTLAVLPAFAPGQTAHAAAAFAPAQLAAFPRGQMTVERAKGRDSFQIWIADTPDRQQQGLMWLRELPADYGMVFVLAEIRPMNMWMKNTYVPLDMLFFGSDGRILSIARNTQPLSLAIIESGAPVAGVVEIRGGEAQRRGIAVGDRVRWAAGAPKL